MKTMDAAGGGYGDPLRFMLLGAHQSDFHRECNRKPLTIVTELSKLPIGSFWKVKKESTLGDSEVRRHNRASSQTRFGATKEGYNPIN